MRSTEARLPQSPRVLLSRREFIGASVAAATLPIASSASAAEQDRSCIFLLLTGGPSQLETWDPKPDAPTEVRGPFDTIATGIAGIRVSEHLPRLASLAHRWALVRSVQHSAAPVHETGLQLLQTGRLSGCSLVHPHVGAMLARRRGAPRHGLPPLAILPGLLENLGVNVSRGQDAEVMGATRDAALVGRLPRPTAKERDAYGRSAFAEDCRRACRLVEAGVRCVVVNMFTTLYDCTTWDCHADRRGLASTLDDYRRTLCPAFDQACAALIEDLHQRGLLARTLVVAAGEMGRTPQLNAFGGRDHWPGVWSVLFAGGGVRGGQVLGASDKWASAPTRHPVHAADIAATVAHVLDLGPAHGWTAGQPIRRLFA